MIAFFLKKLFKQVYYRYRWPNARINFSANISLNSLLGDYCYLASDVSVGSSSIGSYTYVCKDSTIVRADIEQYCSIAEGCLIGLPNHKLNAFSTYPGFYDAFQAGPVDMTNSSCRKSFSSRVLIKADVWIGARTMILSGVTVGTGAVIGCGAVVTKDIEPYSICAGVPARVIGHRRLHERIETMENSRWWTLNHIELKNYFAEKCIYKSCPPDASKFSGSQLNKSFGSYPPRLIEISSMSNSYEKAISYGGSLYCYSYFDCPAEQKNHFINLILSSINENRFFPVYRMADGEFAFLLGAIPARNSTFLTRAKIYIKKLTALSFATSWGETFSRGELKRFRQSLKNVLSEIAIYGMLAIYLVECPYENYTQYNRPILNYLNSLSIRLTARNYVPFHVCLSAVLMEAQRLINGQNILFISSISPEEQNSLRRRLAKHKPQSIEFLSISPSKAYKEKINTNLLRRHPSIVFVSAGIGSAFIMMQLKHLCCPVIDIGGCIHLLSSKKPNYHGSFFKAPV